MYLILQGTMSQVLVLKPCKSDQETSEEVLDFKNQQLARLLVSSRCKKLLKPEARQLAQ